MAFCRQHGDAVMRIRESTRERTLENYVPVPESGCWIFLGCWSRTGYGRCSGEGGLAHRFFYASLVKEIPPGMYVCHKCDTPPCVNPSHLFLGTQDDNMRDCSNKGRAGRPATKTNTPDIVLGIRYSTAPYSVIAKLFNVGIGTVHRVKHGLAGAHLVQGNKAADNLPPGCDGCKETLDGRLVCCINQEDEE